MIVPLRDYITSRFKRRDGSPYSDRTIKNIARELDIPSHRRGWTDYTDTDVADAHLKAVMNLEGNARPRRGRKRALLAG